MGILSNIEPKEVFHYFEELSMVPRSTFHTKKISDFCVEFAKAHNLEYIQDEVNNVIIKKPGTAGYENSDPVIIQGHLDMVATKTTDSDHDFENDPLDLFVDGDLIGAKNTTLGGDDGIAVAYAMAILASTDIPHPPIEAVFTIDEEIGMGGAHHLDTSVLKGKICLNIDSEIEGVMTVGCAGGYIYDTFIPIEWSEENGTKMTIRKYSGAALFWSFTMGVVTALILAAAVFIFISNAPIPFVNKIQQVSTSVDEKLLDGKTIDPNKKLYASGQGSEQTESQVASVTAGNNDATEVVATDRYWVTAGTFSELPDAEKVRGQIAFTGNDAQIEYRREAGKRVYRVRLGPFDNETAAEEIRQTLADNGIQGTVMHQPN